MTDETLTHVESDWIRRAIDAEITDRINEMFRRHWEEEERRILYGDGHLTALDIKRGGLLGREPSAEDVRLIAAGNKALQ